VSQPRVESASELTEAQAEQVLRLVDQVIVAEGVRPLSEHTLLQLHDHDVSGERHVLVDSGGMLAAYAFLEPARDGGPGSAELAGLDPEALRALVEVLARECGGRVLVWARGERSTSAEVLRATGLPPQRVLLQMRRTLDETLPEPSWPDGVTVRTFVVGQDEGAWLAVNNRAFAGHPEQSGWTLADVEARERTTWFDPTGFFLAERGGDLVGFHWTKVHGSDPSAPPGSGAPIGEVYVVGVDPSMQGHHLGGALTSRGLLHLRDRGLPTVMLYVEQTNTSAVRLYERLGFRRFDADVRYELPARD
jgi:mycothiol synthase